MNGTPPAGAEADPLEAGLSALEQTRWEEARDLLEQAVARQESPEALEGLSWALWWLDDAEALFVARERAYALYRERNEPKAAARMAIWLGIDQLDFYAAPAASGAWLGRAQRLLEPLEPSAEHGWLAIQEGYTARIGGDDAAAVRHGETAVELGRRLAVPDLEMLGLALQGATMVCSARVGEGMRCLDEATLLAVEDEAEIPIAGAWAFCFLVSSCITVRDYERASEWCDRIAEFAERYGSRYMFASCRAEYGEIYLWRGRWQEAEELLEASIADFSRSRPPMAAAPLSALAELRRRQGRRDQAEALLKRAGTSARAQLCRARIALDRGEAMEARDLAENVLRGEPGDRRPERAPALEVLMRAQTARGEPELASAALEELRAIGAEVGTEPLRCFGEVGAGLLARATGDLDGARAALMAAAEGFESCSAPFEAAEARTDLAEVLLSLDREDAARRQAAAALSIFEDLGSDHGAARVQTLFDRDGDDNGLADELTAREKEVLVLVSEGLSNKEVAERLTLSEHTVHRHVTNILRKLELPSRAAASAWAAQSGLLDKRS